MSDISPFQTLWYLQTFLNHFVPEIKHIDPIFPFEKQGSDLILLGMRKVEGKEEITDYGGFEMTTDDLIKKAKELNCNRIVLDYIREDNKIYREWIMKKNVTVEKQEVAPFLQLPASWELYMEGLDRVERKELKRKLKRLQTVPYDFTIYPSNQKEIFEKFITLHKLSDSNKNQFMSACMEQFFNDLAKVEKTPWQSNVALLTIEKKPAAAIFFFENDNRVLLYNSGFDPSLKYYSAGLMTHSLLIKRNIEKGLKVHDFLRGNERYKYDLGARDLNLYKISITL